MKINASYFPYLLTLLCAIIGCTSTLDEPPEQIAADLDTSAKSTKPTNGFLGFTFDSIDTTPLIVKSAVAGSPAEAVGIREGDLLIGLEQTPNPTIEDIFERLSETTPGDELQVTIHRDEVNREFNIKLISFDEVESGMEILSTPPGRE